MAQYKKFNYDVAIVVDSKFESDGVGNGGEA
jgi:hypothetical protein